MIGTIFSQYDLACLQQWGISAVEDTRSRAEAEERFVVPEWLRRAMWRQFWAEQDSLFGAMNGADDPGRHKRNCSQARNDFGRASLRLRPVPESQAVIGPEMPDARGSTELIFLERGRTGGAGVIVLLILAIFASSLYLLVRFLEH